MSETPKNRKAPVAQDAESLESLIQEAREALGRLEAVPSMMRKKPLVDKIEVGNFWIFHDGISAISKFTESAIVTLREARLKLGAYNAEGSPVPERASEKPKEKDAKASKK